MTNDLVLCVQVSYQFPVGLGGGPVPPLLMGGPGQGGPPNQHCQAWGSNVVFMYQIQEKNMYSDLQETTLISHSSI